MKHIIEGALLLDSQLSCVFAKVEYQGKDWIIVTPLFRDGRFSPVGDEWCDYAGGLGFEDAERAEVERRILPIMQQMPRAQWRTLGNLEPPPYEEFCHHPERCAGLSSCPRDPTCAD